MDEKGSLSVLKEFLYVMNIELLPLKKRLQQLLLFQMSE